jgi:hypothetical protein
MLGSHKDVSYSLTRHFHIHTTISYHSLTSVIFQRKQNKEIMGESKIWEYLT